MPKRPSKKTSQPLASIHFKAADAWETWLAEHHQTALGIWIKFAKKASGIPTVVYAEALQVALCYGWIDGQVRRLDDRYYLQRFTPRTRRSKWSKINCGHATRLIDQGRMKPPGIRQIEAAKADGRWDAAYDSSKSATVPPDFRKVLKQHPAAEKCFSALSSRNHYAILYYIQDAKRPETRARRIAKFITMLLEGKKPHD